MDKKPDYYQNVRADVIALIRGRAGRVLDVGCACGMTGERLKREGAEEVVGVEFETDACREASKRLDRVFSGDVQSLSLPYGKGYFDCIIYADILEHLTDPWSLLKRQRGLLKDGGCVVASIPNVRHYRVVKKLLKGRWEYKERGVLDATHLRFFTLDGIRRMFDGAGYRIDALEYKISASKTKKFLNRLLAGRLNELLSEQFIIRAVKKDITR